MLRFCYSYVIFFFPSIVNPFVPFPGMCLIVSVMKKILFFLSKIKFCFLCGIRLLTRCVPVFG
jgi:hypothetical protein